MKMIDMKYFLWLNISFAPIWFVLYFNQILNYFGLSYLFLASFLTWKPFFVWIADSCFWNQNDAACEDLHLKFL